MPENNLYMNHFSAEYHIYFHDIAPVQLFGNKEDMDAISIQNYLVI